MKRPHAGSPVTCPPSSQPHSLLEGLKLPTVSLSELLPIVCDLCKSRDKEEWAGCKQPPPVLSGAQRG